MMKRDKTRWDGLSMGQRIRSLELRGYVVMPEVLSRDAVATLRSELDSLPLKAATYSDRQMYVHHVQWSNCVSAIETIADPKILSFLGELFGDDVLAISSTYARTDPQYPRMALHADSQPYGSNIFGAAASAPLSVRVLHYLDDLTTRRAPLLVVPYSHLGMHRDSCPYQRYKKHDEEVAITCRAGSAVIINQRLFHAVGANRSRTSRCVYAIGYRPAWAGPIAAVDEPDLAMLNRLPKHVRKLFASPNLRTVDTTMQNWSGDLRENPPGLGRTRWSPR